MCMPKFKYLILCLGFINNCLANNFQELFLQANQICKTGDYQKALDIYDHIESKGEAVWYNIGNCYFYQKDYVRAIWAWMQACKVGSGEILISSRSNIAVALDLLGIKNYEFGYFKINFLIWQLLILALMLLVLLLLLSYNANNKIWGVSIFLLAAMIFGINFWYVKERKLVYAVVQDSANLVAGPANGYHVLDKIVPGQILKIIRSEADWCYIDHGGVKGWIAKSNLLIV